MTAMTGNPRRGTLALASGLLAALAVLVPATPAAASVAPSAAPVAVGVPVAAAPVAVGVAAAAAPVKTAPIAAAPVKTAPQGPKVPAGPKAPAGSTVKVEINGVTGKPSTPLTIILAMTVLSVAPALLLMCTCFTKILVVLGLTRNALGVMTMPPNQVLAGLALFLSFFIMGPVLGDMNDRGVQPYLKGDKTQAEAYTDGVEPLRDFMVSKTRKEELALFTKVAKEDKPQNAQSVPMTTLVPAFVLSELKSAFIIGFIIFIPFLVIDLIVSAALMSMGMMMLPPVMISLPFKLLLFVLVDGWGLVVTSLVSSYR